MPELRHAICEAPNGIFRPNAAEGEAAASRLFPVGRDDRVVVAEDQIETVWIVGNAPDAARRYDPPQHLGEILLANDPLLAGLRLAALDKLLADAILAVADVDLRLVHSRQLLDLDRILRGAHAHPFEEMALLQWKNRGNRHKTFRQLRLLRHRRNE